MPFSLRLDPETEARIRRLAQATGRSKSAVVREAMAQYAPDEPPAAGGVRSVLQRLGSVVGSVSTGGAHLSSDTHAKYKASLARRHRGRRSR